MGRGVTRLGAAVVVLALVLIPTSAIPAEGNVLFGAHPGGTNDGRLGATTGLEAAIGRQFDFVRVFEVWNSPFPTTFHDDLIGSGRKMLLSVRAKRLDGSYVSWREIANAEPGSPIHDQMVAWIERVRAVGEPIWFTFNHEPEIVENIANGVDTDFKDAWRRVITEFRDRDVPNVEFVWIMTDWSFHVPPSDRRHAAHWYPGDDVVDFIAADAYNWSTCRPGINLPWQSLEPIIAPLRDFGLAHPDKGLMLAEWASSTQGGDKAAWITEAGELLKQPGWEQFMALSYFHRIDPNFPPCNFPLDSSPESLAAFAAMGADPFYGGEGDPVPPPPPPTPVDVVFAAAVDSTNATAPRWISTLYTPTEDGTHDLVLDWDGDANLRIDIRAVSDNSWIGANTTTDQPKTVSVDLTGGETYRIAVWAMSGAASFSLTPDSPQPPPTTTTTSTTSTTSTSTTTTSTTTTTIPTTSTTSTTSTSTTTTTIPTTTTTSSTSTTTTITVPVDPTPEVVFSGEVDSTNAISPRWVSTFYTPALGGDHDLVLDWDGDANVRFDIRVASDGTWLGANTTADQPKTISADLTGGETYRLAVWAMSGVADFTVTSTSPGAG